VEAPKGRGASAVNLSLNGTKWNILYSKRMPLNPATPWEIKLSGKAEPHYIMTKAGDSARSALKDAGSIIQVTIDVVLDPGVTIVATEGTYPAHASVMLQRKGDNLSGVGKYEWFRLWGKAFRLPLTAGQHFIQLPVVPSTFIGVNGKTPSAGRLSDMISGLDKIGLTFGGQFYGHGVRARGGVAKISLKEFVLK
jgi:hypothetical protein